MPFCKIILWNKIPLFVLSIIVLINLSIVYESAYSSNEQISIALEDDPGMVAVNPLTNRAVVTHGHSNANAVSVIDLNTERVLTELSVAKAPRGVAIDTVDNVAVITHENERLLTMIDLNSNIVLAAMMIDTKPNNIAVNSNTHIAAVTSTIEKEVFFVDLRTKTIVAKTVVGTKAGDIAIDSEHNIALVLDKNKNNVNIIDMNNYTLIYSIALDKKPQAIDVNPENNTALIANYQDKSVTIINLSTKSSFLLPVEGCPLDVAFNYIDNRAVILCDKDKKLLLLDLNTNRIINSYPLPRHPESVVVNSIRNVAIVADDEEDGLTIIPLPLSPTFPKIKITSPQDNDQIFSSAVNITGTIENSTNVTVNNNPATISGNAFSAALTLKSGKSTISAMASDKYGRKACDNITIDIVTGTITGTVTNSLTGWLLPLAIVSLTDAKGYTQTLTTVFDGTFSTEIAAGTYTGSIIKPWYFPNAFNGTVVTGGTSKVNIPLIPTPPAISNITVTDITETSAKISWTTDQITGGSVEYGKTTTYGTIASDSVEETSHSVIISNLSPATNYHFRVNALSANGIEIYSPDNSFKTNGQNGHIDITIGYPMDGSEFNGNSVLVTGYISNTANTETRVMVNGVNANLINNQFAVNNIPLIAGQNVITITATDINGITETKIITLNAVIPEKKLKLSANPNSGITPLEISLKIDSNFDISNTYINYSGPGDVQELISENHKEFKYRLTTEGIYYFSALVIGADGNYYLDIMAITVYPFPIEQINLILRNRWEDFKNALINQNIDSAVTNFVAESRETYKKLYTDLKSLLPDIVSELNASRINLISMDSNKAIYEIIVTRNNIAYSFQLEFVKDVDGIWRIFKF